MSIKVFNTLSGKLEELKPLKDKLIRVYVCGPTVYDYMHIGHARTYISFDIIIRYLQYRGYKVIYVMNITNIDDKIIRRAKEKNMDPIELANLYEKYFFEDFEKLRLLKPHITPRVTDHIEDIIKVVNKLIEKGYAYVVDGNVYFDVTKFPDYGKLSKQSLDQIKAGARVEIDLRKKHPADFALWKKSKEDEPGWDSPWGRGRPGWHIECSVMSIKYLGEQFEIHGGGTDLIFPHHENEIAQSEAYTGKKPFVKYWLHTGMLRIKGEKMSKSLGNIIPVRDFLKKYTPDVLRLIVALTHYRKPIDFSYDIAEQAKSSLVRFWSFIRRLTLRIEKATNEGSKYDNEVLSKLEEMKSKFIEAMDNDFHTPDALATIFSFIGWLSGLLNRKDVILSKTTLKKVLDTILELWGVLGFDTRLPEERLDKSTVKLINLLIEIRDKLRKQRQWSLADYIREKLREMGVYVEDTPYGTYWFTIP